MKLRRILTLILLAPLGQVHAQSRGDDAIVAMQQAFRHGDRAKLAQLLPQVRGHALEAWGAYWELKSRLDTASAQEIQDFFARYAGTYQEDRLRNDWLLLLGQRRDWDTFAAEYPKYRMNDDREVRCYAVVAQARDGVVPGMAEEVRRLWLSQREADDGCKTAAALLIAQGQGPGRLTAQDAWRKARLAIEANRPRAAAGAIEIVAPDALGQFAELNASPARYLTSRVVVASRARKELVVLALIKMACSDADSAARLLENKWGPQLAPEERNWVWGVIAKQAAQRLGNGTTDALTLYENVTRDADLSDDMLAWKARAALRGARGFQWRTVLQAIKAMSDAARAEPVWVYWKARALLAQRGEAQHAEARELLQSIASVRGFYEQLALEELGQKITVPPRPEPLTVEEREAARLNPTLNRALYAIALGIRPEGVREWNWGTNLAKPGGMDDRELLAAAQLACDQQVWDRCINASERTKREFDVEQRFPMPHRDLVIPRSQEINLDPAYVYGLIRQESRFIMDARSSVGAAGLMQVMPATARWTARKIGLPNFTPDKLRDRDTNIAIGTGYLKLVLDDFDGSMPLAAAAYNAGPRRPRVWRNGPVMEAAAWAENVPFTETRDYVKKVLANTTMYAAILSGEPQSLRSRLGRVGPRNAADPDPSADLP